ncbi:MAG: SAM-dependent chlorinase/fluorinase [Flavobacteriales bacterium]|nr:SAM-dependent chlorinase/fluorinase [Flavobacteriales bacterium]
MPIITLTTDLGLKDYYVASLKGHILSQLPDTSIIDISHDIPPFNISVAAFCLKNCYQDFPEGTIHIIGVSPEANEHVCHLIIKHNQHYFIGADNGMFSLLFDEKPSEVFNLNIISDNDRRTFPTKDVFVQAACHIGRGGTMELIGSRIDGLTERTNFQPVIEEDVIRGMSMYIDSYGNVTTNITKSLFKLIGKGRDFAIVFRRSDYNIYELKLNYSEVPEGEKLALFSTNNHLEIAINKGNANKLFGLKLSDTIRVEFKSSSTPKDGPDLF